MNSNRKIFFQKTFIQKLEAADAVQMTAINHKSKSSSWTDRQFEEELIYPDSINFGLFQTPSEKDSGEKKLLGFVFARLITLEINNIDGNIADRNLDIDNSVNIKDNDVEITDIYSKQPNTGITETRRRNIETPEQKKSVAENKFSINSQAAYELFLIAVDPEFENLGCGSMLCAHLIKIAESRNIRQITLEVRSRNLKALGLYRKFGFSHQNARRDYYTMPDDHALILTKEINRVGK